jgi:hypothetical protein
MENKRKFVTPDATKELESPLSTPRARSIACAYNLNDFIHDESVIKEIQDAAKNRDDPPLIFDWDTNALQEFLDKISLLPAAAPVAPFPLPAAGATIHDLQIGLITYIQGLVPAIPPPACRTIGYAAGLACTSLQYCNAGIAMRALELHPWFAAVLATVPALTTPLARVWVPRPKVSTGLCDTLTFNCALWH